MQINIRELRQRLGTEEKPISQAELAARLGGISQATVSRMEADPTLQRGPVAVLLQNLDAQSREAA